MPLSLSLYALIYDSDSVHIDDTRIHLTCFANHRTKIPHTRRTHVIRRRCAEYDLQYLHQLPAGLLQDIRLERYEQPALLDEDNVNEFHRVYDDFYGRTQPVTGKKQTPPTRPYVQMVLLYDLLKRDAKQLMLNKFEVNYHF